MPRGIYDRTTSWPPGKPQPKCCCVYAILNTETGETYIGSTKDLIKRIIIHRSRLNTKNGLSPKIREAVEKYGKEAFTFVILEECTYENQFEKETEWLQANKPEYNGWTEDALSTKGIKRSKETRYIMSQNMMGNTNSVGKNLGNTKTLGFKHTKEYCENISRRMMGNQYGRKKPKN